MPNGRSAGQRQQGVGQAEPVIGDDDDDLLIISRTNLVPVLPRFALDQMVKKIWPKSSKNFHPTDQKKIAQLLLAQSFAQ